jgi:hypothetical protein
MLELLNHVLTIGLYYLSIKGTVLMLENLNLPDLIYTLILSTWNLFVRILSIEVKCKIGGSPFENAFCTLIVGVNNLFAHLFLQFADYVHHVARSQNMFAIITILWSSVSVLKHGPKVLISNITELFKKASEYYFYLYKNVDCFTNFLFSSKKKLY